MIQLPSKIRTTLFNVASTLEPIQLFSHEDDRLFVMIYMGQSVGAFPMFGRSGADAINSDSIYPSQNTPVILYGPEPIWFVTGAHGIPATGGMYIVHGVYRA